MVLKQKMFLKKNKTLENEVQDLQPDILNLKDYIQLKEEQLDQTKDTLQETVAKYEELRRELINKNTLQNTVTDEKSNCSAFDFKTGQKRDMENHNKSMHEELFWTTILIKRVYRIFV